MINNNIVLYRNCRFGSVRELDSYLNGPMTEQSYLPFFLASTGLSTHLADALEPDLRQFRDYIDKRVQTHKAALSPELRRREARAVNAILQSEYLNHYDTISEFRSFNSEYPCVPFAGVGPLAWDVFNQRLEEKGLEPILFSRRR